MLLLENFRLFRLSTKTHGCFGTLPFCWSNDNEQLELISDPKFLKRLDQKCKLHLSFIFILMLQAWLTFHSSSITDKMVQHLELIITVGSAFFLFTCRTKAGEIVLFVNGIYKAAKDNQSKPKRNIFGILSLIFLKY